MYTSITYLGIIDAPVFVDILWLTFLAFVLSVYSGGHSFMQDKDPKHASILGDSFLQSNGINWLKNPPESPDMNSIENFWHELKEYIRREVTARNKD